MKNQMKTFILFDVKQGKCYGVDPLAEKYPSWNPYRYGFNNPIKIITAQEMKSKWGRKLGIQL